MKKSDLDKYNLNGIQLIRVVIGVVAILFMFIVCILWKTNTEVPIASSSNDVVCLSNNNSISQSWEAYSKNVTGICLNIDTKGCKNLRGKLTVSFSDKRSGQTIVEKEINLSDIANKDKYFAKWKYTEITLGQRYYITCSISDAGTDTVLALRTNHDYSGLYINGAAGTGALSASFVSSKRSFPAWIGLIILLFSGIALFISLFTNRTFEETLPLAFVFVFCWLFIWGIFDHLVYGINSLVFIGMICSALLPYILTVKKYRVWDFVTPAFFAFWGIFITYVFLDRNVVAGRTDDLNHWETCIRDMWYYNSFPFHKESFVTFSRYTPGMAIIEYLFVYLYGSFREGIIMVACHMTGFVFLSALFTHVRWKQFHKVIPITMIVLAIPLIVYQYHYGILHVDAYLGIVGAYMLICYFTEDLNFFNLLRIMAASLFLSMIKETGIAIAGIAYLIIIFDVMRKKKALMHNTILTALSSMSAIIIWQIYMAVKGFENGLTLFLNMVSSKLGMLIIAQASNNQNLITQSANGNVSPEKYNLTEIIKATISFYFSGSFFCERTYIEIILFLLLPCAAFSIIGYYQRINVPLKSIVLYLFAGTIVYSIFMDICYWALFNDGTPIPAARRYFGSFLLLTIIVIIGVSVINYNENANNNKQQFLIWIAGIMLIMFIPSSNPYYANENNFPEYFRIWKQDQEVGEVFRSFADKNEKCYFISYKDSTIAPKYNYLTFYNAIAPVKAQGINSPWKPITEYHECYNTFAEIETKEEFAQNLINGGYNYIYLHDIDDYFIDKYGTLFKNENEITNGGIYKIEKKNGSIVLTKIAEKDLT